MIELLGVDLPIAITTTPFTLQDTLLSKFLTVSDFTVRSDFLYKPPSLSELLWGYL